MEIDAITRNKLKNVMFTSTEPPSTNVLWAKPNGNEVTMYIFKNGSWVSLKSEGLEPIVQAYIDSQDLATLNSAKDYADSNLAAEVTRAKEAETAIQETATTNTTDISTLKGYFEDGVANKAKQLSTTVELWGNKFDGTQNITGDLTIPGTLGNSTLCIKGVVSGTDYTHLYITQNHRPIVMQYGYGKVGIGTPTPTAKLEVAGDFKTTQSATIGGDLNVTGSINVTTPPWATPESVTAALEEAQPKVWANVLATADTVIKVDGEKVELPAHKNVILKNFSSVEPWEANEGRIEYLTDIITRFDFHYNDKSPIVPINAFNLHTLLFKPNYSQLSQLDVSCWDTSGMTSMTTMFYGYNKLTHLDVGGFDTSNVTDMGSMFSICSSLTYLDVGGFDTSKVTTTESMFALCDKLTYLDTSKWNLSNVDSAYMMFYNCNVLNNLDVSNWNANIRDMQCMFLNCEALSSLDVSKWSTSNTFSLSSMFKNCQSLTNIIFGEGWGKNTRALFLNLSECGTRVNSKLSDETYESMLTMYDRAANGLTTTFTIQFTSKHNIPDGWTDKMTAKGYTITIS